MSNSLSDQFLIDRDTIKIFLERCIIIQAFPIIDDILLNQTRESFVELLFLDGFQSCFSCWNILTKKRLLFVPDTELITDSFDLNDIENIQIFL